VELILQAQSTRPQRRLHHIDTNSGIETGTRSRRKVGTVAHGLGFKKEDWTRRTEHFSAAGRCGFALAKLLLSKPNMLLLDEPTNHLDLELATARAISHELSFAYLLISHDRYFLDVTVNRTVEIWNKRVQFYTEITNRICAESKSAARTPGRVQESHDRISNSKRSSIDFARRDQGKAGPVAHQRGGKD